MTRNMIITIDGHKYMRVQKLAAHKFYRERVIYLFPCKLVPSSNTLKAYMKEVPADSDFKAFVQNYEEENCNYLTGTYASYFTEIG